MSRSFDDLIRGDTRWKARLFDASLLTGSCLQVQRALLAFRALRQQSGSVLKHVPDDVLATLLWTIRYSVGAAVSRACETGWRPTSQLTWPLPLLQPS